MKKVIALALISMLVWACGREYMAPGPAPAQSLVYTSEKDFNNTVQVNGRITLADISPGVTSRKWTLPESAEMIGTTTKSMESGESVLNVKFTKSGTYAVKLEQIFNKEAYVNGVLRGTNIDTTLTINVLDSVEVKLAGQKLSTSGLPVSALDIKKSALNEIEAGKFIELSPTLVGQPETVTWILDGAVTPRVTSNAPIKVKYNKTGVYNVRLVASRTRPGGADTLDLPQLFRVIPSSDPVTLDAISGVPSDKNKLAITFSRDMDPATIVPSEFSVSVLNKNAPVNVKVSSVQLDATKQSVVVLTLSGVVYDDDVVKVTYNGQSLSSADGVKAIKVADRSVLFAKVNLLDGTGYDKGFETTTADNWPYLGWGGIYSEYKFNISTAESHSGGKSAFVEFKPNGGMIIGHVMNGERVRFAAKAGKKYEIGYWVKIKSAGKPKAGANATDIRFFWEPNTNWGVGANDIDATLPVNEWVYMRAPYAEFTKDGNYQFMIRGYSENNSETVSFYLDDISVSEVSLRP